MVCSGFSGAQFNRKNIAPKITPKMAPKPSFEKDTCMNCHFRHFLIVTIDAILGAVFGAIFGAIFFY